MKKDIENSSLKELKMLMTIPKLYLSNYFIYCTKDKNKMRQKSSKKCLLSQLKTVQIRKKGFKNF